MHARPLHKLLKNKVFFLDEFRPSRLNEAVDGTTPTKEEEMEQRNEITRTPRQYQVPNQRAFGITFGIEIECLLPIGSVRAGAYHAGRELGGRFPTGWNAQKDSSLNTTLRGYEGVEIVSPILKGTDGIDQVKKVASLLEEMGARVNKTCGFHVHVGVRSIAGHDYDQVADFVRRLLKLTAQHEMAFYGASGSESRYTSRYCASIAKGKWAARKDGALAKKSLNAEELRLAAAGIDRYQLLNVAPVFDSRKTVEFRVFSGTTSALKMTAYIQMALAAASRAMDNDTGFDAISTKYAGGGSAGAMKRFFYLMGWTRGRKDYYQPECKVEGWIDDMGNLKATKKELMRLARKFDEQVRQ